MRDLRDPAELGVTYLALRRAGTSIKHAVHASAALYRDDPEGANVKHGAEREALLRRFAEADKPILTRTVDLPVNPFPEV